MDSTRTGVPDHPRRRLLLPAALLLLSLGGAAVLASWAITTTRRHRATAERALTDYAELGAFVLSSHIRRQLGDAATRTLASWVPGRAGVVPAGTACPGGNTFFEERAGALRFTGAQLPPSQTAFLRDSLVVSAGNANRLLEEAHWRLRFVRAPAGPVDGYFVFRRSGLAGFSVCFRDAAGAAGSPSSFREVMLNEPVLPPTFTGDAPPDSLYSVMVAAGHGRALYRSPVVFASPYHGQARLGAEFGDLSLRLDLNPAKADRLIIGGIPSSPSPLALGLLGLSAFLVVAALLQLRREYQLVAMRAHFVSSMSHELRTPLSQILIFTELLKLGRMRSEDERMRSIDIIDQETRRLIRLVENATRFSRAGSAPGTSGATAIPVATAVREALDAFRPLAATRGVTLCADLAAQASARVDPHVLRQIMVNLLDNAMKYGPRGQTVRVHLRLLEDRTRIMVDDQGPGVPRAERERVWEAYYRLPREERSAIAGTGIGLAVVRTLAAEARGRTWVEDADTGGARFVVELPANHARMKRILLVEDNADLAFGLRTALEVEGYEVIHSETGTDGLARARTSACNLIVLDLMLPELNGYEILRQLRHDGNVTPVLILTAKGEEADKVQGFRLGADDYVVKPIGVLEFLARVAALLRRADLASAGAAYRFGDLEVDAPRRTVTVAGCECSLSPLEFDLLHLLARRGGNLVSRKELLREVWGYRADVESRTVNTHIAKIRAKIDVGATSHIATVRKRGYRLR